MGFCVVAQFRCLTSIAYKNAIEEVNTMKNRLFWMLIAGLVLLMGSSTWVSAKSDNSGDGSYTSADKIATDSEDQ
jgi:hypothetical protein